MTGKVEITGTGTQPTIRLSGDAGTIAVGTNGANGTVFVGDEGPLPSIIMDGKARYFQINAKPGVLPTLSLRGESGEIAAGGNGVEGTLALYPASSNGGHNDLSRANIHLAAADGFIRLGGATGAGGHLILYPAGAAEILHDVGKASIHLDGQAGDISLGNADCAEDFDVDDEACVDPGTVMVISEGGRLRTSEREYDRRVAGVISGANDLRPGIVLGRKRACAARHPLALAGQVYCKVDATDCRIEIGDLLTTSANPGYAMRAKDPLKAFGAVIGKALSPLSAGLGLVRILVALQ
jgi:hypothetical protein